MPPAPAIAGGKGQRTFADCRRQKQTGKTGKKIPVKLSKMNDFMTLSWYVYNYHFQMTRNLHKTEF